MSVRHFALAVAAATLLAACAGDADPPQGPRPVLVGWA